jgi:hypothetical protein
MADKTPFGGERAEGRRAGALHPPAAPALYHRTDAGRRR